MTTSNQNTVVYYDDEPGIGVNAYFDFGHEFFTSLSQLRLFCDIELGGFVELIAITDDNYTDLKVQGVFDVI